MFGMDDKKFRLERFLNDPHHTLIGYPDRGVVKTSAESSSKPVFVPRYPPQRTTSGSEQSTISHDSSQLSEPSSVTSLDSLASQILTGQPVHTGFGERPGPDPQLGIGTMSAIGHDYYLPCPLFDIMDCRFRFHPDDIERWILHSESHFHPSGPPPKSVCNFCDQMNERFDSTVTGDRYESWLNKMLHISQHYALGDLPENSRPDFFVLEYLKRIEAIDLEDYNNAVAYTERPPVDGLVDSDVESPSQARARREQQRRERVVDDLAKEKRAIRRAGVRRR
ncbi:hypothetical protein B7463_g4390, partial [Scytalidium lignicola]